MDKYQLITADELVENGKKFAAGTVVGEFVCDSRITAPMVGRYLRSKQIIARSRGKATEQSCNCEALRSERNQLLKIRDDLVRKSDELQAQRDEAAKARDQLRKEFAELQAKCQSLQAKQEQLKDKSAPTQAEPAPKKTQNQAGDSAGK